MGTLSLFCANWWDELVVRHWRNCDLDLLWVELTPFWIRPDMGFTRRELVAKWVANFRRGERA